MEHSTSTCGCGRGEGDAKGGPENQGYLLGVAIVVMRFPD